MGRTGTPLPGYAAKAVISAAADPAPVPHGRLSVDSSKCLHLFVDGHNTAARISAPGNTLVFSGCCNACSGLQCTCEALGRSAPR